MNKIILILILVPATAILSGCAQVTEVGKTLYGSSTRALENARTDARHKTFNCSVNECYDVVLAMTTTKLDRPVRTEDVYKKDGSITNFGGLELSSSQDDRDEPVGLAPKRKVEEVDPNKDPGDIDVSTLPKRPILQLFLKDRREQHMVVMGVPGSVDTTEVGIFFDPAETTGVKVDVTSLSSNARRIVAEMIFAELSAQFGEVSE